MPEKVVHCSICGYAVKGYDFYERMSKLRRHRKEAHPKAHKGSVKKGLRTKRKRGIIHDPHYPYCDPEKKLKVRTRAIEKPRVVRVRDIKGSGLFRVLEREDESRFPELAIYPKRIDQKALKDAGFKEEKRNYWVLRTNKFNLFVIK